MLGLGLSRGERRPGEPENRDEGCKGILSFGRSFEKGAPSAPRRGHRMRTMADVIVPRDELDLSG